MRQILARAIVVGAVVLGVAACSGGEPSSQPSHEVSNRVVSPSKSQTPSTEERYRALAELELKKALSSKSSTLNEVIVFGTCAGRYAALSAEDNVPDKAGVAAYIKNLMVTGTYFATEYAKRDGSSDVNQTLLAQTLATLEKTKSDAWSSTRASLAQGLSGRDAFELTVPCKKRVFLMAQALCFSDPTQSNSFECLKN
ncbi:MAG: hypothetical protein JKY34_12790 [Kordiimonadaceae bacterium]|nr:hypothetical protein [Kordiimonadaceae bacterium]